MKRARSRVAVGVLAALIGALAANGPVSPQRSQVAFADLTQVLLGDTEHQCDGDAIELAPSPVILQLTALGWFSPRPEGPVAPAEPSGRRLPRGPPRRCS